MAKNLEWPFGSLYSMKTLQKSKKLAQTPYSGM